MQIDEKLLDNLFIPYFSEADEGSVITLLQLNWFYDHKQKVGAFTKEELEYIINKQIGLGKIEIISNTQYRKVNTTSHKPIFSITIHEIKEASKEYSIDFNKKYRALQNT